VSAPSWAHQQLVLWIARKMVADGFTLCGVDGAVPQISGSLPRPPELGAVRADVCGMRLADGAVAFGEAKTSADIASAHTRGQLDVEARLVTTEGENRCRIYLAVPRSAAARLDAALSRLGLLSAKHVVRLHVPDILLEHADD
jgi:hypothetical protein